MFSRGNIEEALVNEGKFTAAEAERAAKIVFKSISSELASGGRVTLPRFGTFEVRERAARNGVNPATGEKIAIPACKAVSFHAGQQLRDAVNGKAKE